MNDEQVPTDGVTAHTVIDKNESVGQRLDASIISNFCKLSPPFTATHTALIKLIRHKTIDQQLSKDAKFL